MSKLRVDQIQSTQHATSTIDLTSSGAAVNGDCSATTFTGDGSNLTNIPVDLTNLDAANLSSGLIPDARFPATLPAVDGSNLTGISAGALEHVADYTVPSGTTTTSLVIFPNNNSGAGGETAGFPANNKYLLRGYVSMNSNGGHLAIHPHIWDSSSNYQYGSGWSLSSASSYNTSTSHYGGGSGNQSSSEWLVYEGGYYWYNATFELWFTTYNRPHAHSRLMGDPNVDAVCLGSHTDTSNRDYRRINGFTFKNSWGYSFTDKTKLSLYKYSNY